MSNYDFIIIGAGASGLLLADAFCKDVFFSNKKILLLDKSMKDKNDRTWCFWEKGEGAFDSILYQSWRNIRFAGSRVDIKPSIAPYQYKMLRGLDFNNSYLERVTSHHDITFLNEEVISLKEEKEHCVVNTAKNSYLGQYVFDSRFDYLTLRRQSKFPVLQQHFLGWFIKTEKAVFDSVTATFMDFSIAQKNNTRFMYVLPFSENEGLVEYTLFSESVLRKEEYEEAIKDYITNDLGVATYEITEVEQGNIPMSCYDFTATNSERVLKIGIAGGWAKASTGYTFYKSSKKVRQLVGFLKTEKPLCQFEKRNRFWWYDLLFLDVLYSNNAMGKLLFESLFKKRNPDLVLKFLDEETNFWEELKVMWACPKWLFLKALFKRVLT